MIADVDRDGSGAIDFDEFVYMMSDKIGERSNKQELTKAFNIIDHDKNVTFFINETCSLTLETDVLWWKTGKDIDFRHQEYC